MADLEAVLADVSYLMAMEKSKCTPAARASKKINLPDPRYTNFLFTPRFPSTRRLSADMVWFYGSIRGGGGRRGSGSGTDTDTDTNTDRRSRRTSPHFLPLPSLSLSLLSASYFPSSFLPLSLSSLVYSPFETPSLSIHVRLLVDIV